ncbi:MAG: ATP-binding cassette domain-containing protein [Patescibacteria group bacterium]|jgi:cell division transport system ATP-binding protein
MIRFEHVYKNYQAGNFALEDINLEIEKGEFVFLIGPSGSGKTTLLKLLMRELLPSEGNVYVDNEIISERRFRHTDVLRKKMGVIFQDFKIVSDKNILENVMIALSILKIKNAKEEALSHLRQVGLEKKSLFFPLQLSAGELQRLAIARAVAGGRNIILADEPTGNLDPVTTWEIIRLFRKIQTKDTTILFATHNHDIVNTLRKRVIVLKQGKIIKDSHEGVYSLDKT